MGGGEVSAGLHTGKHGRMEHGFREHKRLEEKEECERIGTPVVVFLKCCAIARLDPLGLSFVSTSHNSKYL